MGMDLKGSWPRHFPFFFLSLSQDRWYNHVTDLPRTVLLELLRIPCKGYENRSIVFVVRQVLAIRLGILIIILRHEISSAGFVTQTCQLLSSISYPFDRLLVLSLPYVSFAELQSKQCFEGSARLFVSFLVPWLK